MPLIYGGLAEWTIAAVLKLNPKFECTKGNLGCRTSLIKQFDEIFELQGKLSVIMYMFSIAEPGP